MDLNPGEAILALSEAKIGPDQRVDSKVEEEDPPTEEDSREGSLTKAPLLRDHMYLASSKIKTKTDAIIVIKGDTSQPIALRKIRPSLQSLPKGKRFEDYTYAYRGAEEPQLATATAMPQAYEEALSAMH